MLFDLSIRDNIAYGDTTRTFGDKEIIEAARSANIHDFISSLPKVSAGFTPGNFSATSDR